jgi:hypothetical protein
MKTMTIAASAIGLTLMGTAWLAEAKLDPIVTPPHLICNPQAKVYPLHEQTPYAKQTLEQKMLTMLNRHEGQLATRATGTAL